MFSSVGVRARVWMCARATVVGVGVSAAALVDMVSIRVGMSV